MNIKRAVLFGALLWVLIFFEVSVLMFGFNIKADNASYYLFHFPLSAILVLLTGIFYFKYDKPLKKKSSNSLRMGIYNGILVGFVFALVGLALDALITIPLFVKDYYFLLDTALLMGYAMAIVLLGILGAIFSVLKK